MYLLIFFKRSTKQAAKQPASCEVSYPNVQDFVSYTSGSHILDFYVSKKCYHGEAVQIEKCAKPKNGHQLVFWPLEVKTFYHTSLAKKAKFLITFLLSTTQQQSVHKG